MARDQYIQWDPGLPEVRRGQVWRLFTPMFLHFDILHILFNMLWLRDLGSMIEARKTSWLLLLLVLVIAGTSNVAQYLVSGPAFGGMSGVVYGLLGYIWMQGRFNPASRLSLQPQTVTVHDRVVLRMPAGLVGPYRQHGPCRRPRRRNRLGFHRRPPVRRPCAGLTAREFGEFPPSRHRPALRQYVHGQHPQTGGRTMAEETEEMTCEQCGQVIEDGVCSGWRREAG